MLEEWKGAVAEKVEVVVKREGECVKSRRAHRREVAVPEQERREQELQYCIQGC